MDHLDNRVPSPSINNAGWPPEKKAAVLLGSLALISFLGAVVIAGYSGHKFDSFQSFWNSRLEKILVISFPNTALVFGLGATFSICLVHRHPPKKHKTEAKVTIDPITNEPLPLANDSQLEAPPIPEIVESKPTPYPNFDAIHRTLIKNPRHLLYSPPFTARYSLRECGCLQKTHARAPLENHTVDRVAKLFPNKSETLSIVSVGAGGCFQEMVYLAKLATLGYKKIHLVVIETDPSTLNALDELKQLMKDHFPELEFTTQLFTDFEAYVSEGKANSILKPNLLLLMDIDGEKNDKFFGSNLLEHSYYTIRPIIPDGSIITYTRPYLFNNQQVINVGVCSNYEAKMSQGQGPAEYLRRTNQHWTC